MHYIEIYDENWNVIRRLSFPAKDIRKVFSKIKSLNQEKKRFKHYFVD